VIVVDASVVAPALADDSDNGDRARHRLRGETLVVPELLDLEVVSVLRKLHARGDLPARRGRLAIADLHALPARRASHGPLVDRIWELRSNVTPYDATYVALAEALGVPLLTADAQLAHAPGPVCRIELIG
jgi:predicted nucleic acid-binding protein